MLVEVMAVAIRAPGRAIVTERNVLLYPEGSRLGLGAALEMMLKALDGKRLPALQRAVLYVCQRVGGNAKVRMASGRTVPAGGVGLPIGSGLWLAV